MGEVIPFAAPDDPRVAVAKLAASFDHDPSALAMMLVTLIGQHVHATSHLETSLVASRALGALGGGGRA